MGVAAPPLMTTEEMLALPDTGMRRWLIEGQLRERPVQDRQRGRPMTYRNRWQVELFFRWIKCILRCRHFLAASPRGVALQLYLALIAAALLQLHLGRRPSLRLWEALQFYFLGVFTDRDLAAAILQEKALLAAKAAKKS